MSTRRTPRPTYFRTAGAFRRWLEAHHAGTSELIVGIYKKDSGRGGVTYDEALDEALCFGWIDGVRRAMDPASFSVRFTPRRPKSYWSQVNRARAEALIASGRMRPSGMDAWERRDAIGERRYSFERRTALSPEYQRRLEANRGAWEWFSTRPAGYQRIAGHWVTSARQEATRERRLATLIDCCATGRAIPAYPGPPPGPARATSRQKKVTGRSPRPATSPRPPTKRHPR